MPIALTTTDSLLLMGCMSLALKWNASKSCSSSMMSSSIIRSFRTPCRPLSTSMHDAMMCRAAFNSALEGSNSRCKFLTTCLVETNTFLNRIITVLAIVVNSMYSRERCCQVECQIKNEKIYTKFPLLLCILEGAIHVFLRGAIQYHCLLSMRARMCFDPNIHYCMLLNLHITYSIFEK